MYLLESICIYLETFIHLLGVIFNLLLIYCILTKSPKNIASYSFFLLNIALSDTFTCIVSVFVQPRLVTLEDNIFYICNGLCKFFGRKYCFAGYLTEAMLYSHLNWSMLASFVYRWYVLYYEPPKKSHILIVLFCVVLPTIGVAYIAAPTMLDSWDTDFSINVSIIHPEINTAELTIFGIPHAITDFRKAIPTAWITLPIFPITIAIFIIRRCILKGLSVEVHLSESSKKLHASFLKALTLQALLPLLYLVGCFFFWINLIIHHIVLEAGIAFLISLIPVLSPLFPLYLVKPYWQGIGRLFCNEVAVPLGIHNSNVSSNNSSDPPNCKEDYN